jgi:phosphocarrier protein HPr
MVSREFIVKNQLGLHARPAAKLVQLASKFKSEIRVKYGETEVNGKSVLGIMMLAAVSGSTIKVVADGADEKKAVEEIGRLFDRFFECDEGEKP